MTGAIILMLIVCCAMMFIMKKKKATASNAKRADQNPVPLSYSKDELRIENVETGGMIQITGIGPDLDELDVKILAKHLYKQGGSKWYELEGESVSGKVWIDLEEDDELELTISLKKMRLNAIGLTKKDLERIDEAEKGQFDYEGETYLYEDSDEAVFYKHADLSNGETFDYWDFENKAGNKFIGIELWDDGGYDVSYSEPIASHQITVFSLKGSEE